MAPQPVEIEYGKPHKTLDRIGSIVGIPAKILTLNKKTDNHNISPETVDRLRVYLEENDITDVYVAVNDYDPKGQWQRLRQNDRIDPFWRYSLGTLSWVGYTVFPNRIFGGDRYNPFTNTLNLSSDVPALVLAEAAYAKDIHSQKHPGAYAALVNDLPVLSPFRQAKAASDVLGYARAECDWKTEEQAYQVLYPRIGSSAVGPAGHFVPIVGPFLGWAAAGVGHVAGRTVALTQKPKSAPDAPPTGDPAPVQRSLVADKQAAGRNPRAAPSEPVAQEQAGVVQASFEEAAPNKPR